MPPYGKMKASSMLPIRNKLSCQPSDGFILSDKAWCPRRRNCIYILNIYSFFYIFLFLNIINNKNFNQNIKLMING